ncbi:MAG: hypothetical protein QXP31_00365 [Pyrobaculum sp.]
MQLEELTKAFGGRGELTKASQWGIWLGARWWTEKKDKSTRVAKALYTGLATAGLLNSDGSVKNVRRPEDPVNSYVAEHVAFLEALGRLGLDDVDNNQVDRNSLEILRTSLQLSAWRLAVARAVLTQLAGQVVLEPLVQEGVLAHVATEEAGVEKYLGYGARRETAEAIAPKAEFYDVVTACHLTAQVDAVVLFEKLPWLLDPLKELSCLATRLKPGGYVYVVEPDASVSPAYSAALVALGAMRAVPARQVEMWLSAAGLRQQSKPSSFPPYYISVWRKPAKPSLSPSDRWME